MRLSELQKFVLLKCYQKTGAPTNRDVLLSFYGTHEGTSRIDLRQKILTQSLENLIDKELATGFGRRTPHKWFLDNVELTDKGVKEARRLLGEQLKLPIKMKV